MCPPGRLVFFSACFLLSGSGGSRLRKDALLQQTLALPPTLVLAMKLVLLHHPNDAVRCLQLELRSLLSDGRLESGIVFEQLQHPVALRRAGRPALDCLLVPPFPARAKRRGVEVSCRGWWLRGPRALHLPDQSSDGGASRGLVPDGLGAWILPRLVGLQKAKELVFLAEDVPAEEAQRLGLCNRVVPGADLRDAATEWAERLASGPTRSFMLSKWLLNRSLDVDRRTLEDNEAWAVELISGTEDAAEGVASFLERRDPSWRGF